MSARVNNQEECDHGLERTLAISCVTSHITLSSKLILLLCLLSQGGFDLLGSPIGPSSHCEATILNRVRKVQEVLARLPNLQDSQMDTIPSSAPASPSLRWSSSFAPALQATLKRLPLLLIMLHVCGRHYRT